MVASANLRPDPTSLSADRPEGEPTREVASEMQRKMPDPPTDEVESGNAESTAQAAEKRQFPQLRSGKRHFPRLPTQRGQTDSSLLRPSAPSLQASQHEQPDTAPEGALGPKQGTTTAPRDEPEANAPLTVSTEDGTQKCRVPTISTPNQKPAEGPTTTTKFLGEETIPLQHLKTKNGSRQVNSLLTQEPLQLTLRARRRDLTQNGQNYVQFLCGCHRRPPPI